MANQMVEILTTRLNELEAYKLRITETEAAVYESWKNKIIEEVQAKEALNLLVKKSDSVDKIEVTIRLTLQKLDTMAREVIESDFKDGNGMDRSWGRIRNEINSLSYNLNNIWN